MAVDTFVIEPVSMKLATGQAFKFLMTVGAARRIRKRLGISILDRGSKAIVDYLGAPERDEEDLLPLLADCAVRWDEEHQCLVHDPAFGAIPAEVLVENVPMQAGLNSFVAAMLRGLEGLPQVAVPARAAEPPQ